MSLHTLRYWGVPGKGEASRLALHCSELNWKDEMMTGETWGPLKASLIDTIPNVNIPMLEVDGGI